MTNKLIFFLFLLIPSYFLECSVINPDLAPQILKSNGLDAGYEEFAKGRTYLHEENWEKAIYYLEQAVEKSYKPIFKCSNFLDDEGNCNVCDDYNEDIKGFCIRNIDYEIFICIYRFSHFYLALAYLQQHEIIKADFHFTEAIGFKTINDLGLNFYKCASLINPSWICFSILTKIQMKKFKEANSLLELAYWTLDQFDYSLAWGDHWRGNICSKYWKDLNERSLTSNLWQDIQLIILLNTACIVENAKNDLEEAIYFASQAINRKNFLIKELLISEYSDYFVLYYNRGILYFQKKLYAEAIEDFTKTIELNPFDPEAFYQRGSVYLIQDDYTKALVDYNQAISLDPSNSKYYRQRAIANIFAGKIDETRYDLELSHKFEFNQNELGLIEFFKGAYENAIDHFNQFIKLKPDHSIGYRNRGSAWYYKGRLRNAITDYDIAIQLDPSQADLYQLKAIALMSLSVENSEKENSYQLEARTNFFTALELNPNDFHIYQNIATLFYFTDDLETSIDYYKKALKLAPIQNHIDLLKKLIFIYFKLNKYEEAISCCEKAILLQPYDGEIYFILGNCLSKHEKFQKAIENYDFAIQVGYDQPEIYFNRAKAFFCLHLIDQALIDITRVLERDENHIESYKLRGFIFLLIHKEQEAYADFMNALKITSKISSINFSQDNLKFSQNEKQLLFCLDDYLLLSSINKSSFISHIPFVKTKLIEKIDQINFNDFAKGLIAGLFEGGIETIKELGPFITNLLFHPIETADEILTVIKFLVIKTLDQEWETVFEVLAPEFKELFFTWDEIEDFHKGKLTGLFVGRNGVMALTVLGGAKTLSKLKKIVIGSKSESCFNILMKTKLEIPSFPPLETNLISSKKKCWNFSYSEGSIIQSNFRIEQPIGKIIPNFKENQSILEAKAIRKSSEFGIIWEDLEKNIIIEHEKALKFDSKEISPALFEIEIANGKSWRETIEITVDEKQNILTSLHGTKLEKIFIRNLNTKKHIMQSKHAWNKLIKLTGNLEEDCKKVLNILEVNQINLEKYRLGPVRKFADYIRYDHQMTINGFQIRAIFNKYVETGEMFLNDAWVITNE